MSDMNRKSIADRLSEFLDDVERVGPESLVTITSARTVEEKQAAIEAHNGLMKDLMFLHDIPMIVGEKFLYSE